MLDFPYLYKLDGNKLYCNAHLDDGSICGGVIDYDEGYNKLYCTKCGRRYRAQELAASIKDDKVIVKGGQTKMKVAHGYGDDVRIINDTDWYSDTRPKLVGKKKGKKANIGSLKVNISGKGIDKKNIDVEEFNSDEEDEPTVTAKVTRGTIVHAKEEVVEDLVESTENTVIDKEEEPVKGQALVKTFKGEIVSSVDIDGVEEDRTKWLLITENSGEAYETLEAKYNVITHILNRPLSELAIVTKEAQDQLLDTIADLKDDNHILKDSKAKLEETLKNTNESKDKVISELHKTINTDVSSYDQLEKEYKKLEDEYNNLVEDYNELAEKYDELMKAYTGNSSFEPDKEDSTEEVLLEEGEELVEEDDGRDYFEDVEEEKRVEKTIEFDVGSPLLREDEEDITFGGSMQNALKNVPYEDLPTGAVPPSNK